MIGAVVSYCTNDFRFLSRLIAELKMTVDQIVIPVCDHFFDGKPENRFLLNWSYALHPDVTFIEVPFHSQLFSGPHTWHSTMRLIGFLHLTTSWILFVDADEIPEGKRLAQWAASSQKSWAHRFDAYYYDLTPNRQVQGSQESALLLSREGVVPSMLSSPLERAGLFSHIFGPKQSHTRGLDGNPMFHHYSWCRTKSESMRKVASWGHRDDLYWDQIIPRAYRENSLRSTLARELSFQEIIPFFDPLSVSIPKQEPLKGPFSNVIVYDKDWHHHLVLHA